MSDKIIQNEEPVLITTDEASKLLFITAATVRRYIKEKKLRAVKKGLSRRLLIYKSDCDALLKA
jgi:excisionase family DNA binding protein